MAERVATAYQLVQFTSDLKADPIAGWQRDRVLREVAEAMDCSQAQLTTWLKHAEEHGSKQERGWCALLAGRRGEAACFFDTGESQLSSLGREGAIQTAFESGDPRWIAELWATQLRQCDSDWYMGHLWKVILDPEKSPAEAAFAAGETSRGLLPDPPAPGSGASPLTVGIFGQAVRLAGLEKDPQRLFDCLYMYAYGLGHAGQVAEALAVNERLLSLSSEAYVTGCADWPRREKVLRQKRWLLEKAGRLQEKEGTLRQLLKLHADSCQDDTMQAPYNEFNLTLDLAQTLQSAGRSIEGEQLLRGALEALKSRVNTPEETSSARLELAIFLERAGNSRETVSLLGPAQLSDHDFLTIPHPELPHAEIIGHLNKHQRAEDLEFFVRRQIEAALLRYDEFDERSRILRVLLRDYATASRKLQRSMPTIRESIRSLWDSAGREASRFDALWGLSFPPGRCEVFVAGSRVVFVSDHNSRTIQTYDVLVSIEGQPVQWPEEVDEISRRFRGREISLTVRRDGKLLELPRSLWWLSSHGLKSRVSQPWDLENLNK